MCRQSDSIEQRRRATKDLSEACCKGGPTLRQLWEETVAEPLTPELEALTAQLNRIN